MEKPILFNTEMVQTILKGAKSSTRRPIKKDIADYLDIGDCLQCTDSEGKAFNINYPYQVGDILYVRETFFIGDILDEAEDISERGIILYRADERRRNIDYEFLKWRPSIHMPRKIARLFLKVTDVKIERLQDITEKQAIREGCEGVKCKKEHDYTKDEPCGFCINSGYIVPPQLEFHDLWNNIYSEQGYGWCKNPWVWAIEFEKVK